MKHSSGWGIQHEYDEDDDYDDDCDHEHGVSGDWIFNKVSKANASPKRLNKFNERMKSAGARVAGPSGHPSNRRDKMATKYGEARTGVILHKNFNQMKAIHAKMKGGK